MLSITIPAYNEEKRIGKTLKEYVDFFREKKKNKEIDNFEIVVVANACKDNTVGVVKKIQKKFREVKLLDFEKGGKGFAIKEGFKDALKRRAELIGFVDADLATPPRAFYGLVRHIKDNDAIIGSRYIKGSKIIPKFSFRRIFVAKVFNLLVRGLFLFPYRDTQCGAKLIKRNVLEKVLPKLSMSQWAFDIDLLYNLRKLGFRVKEIPTYWIDVEGSKIKERGGLLRASIQMFFAVLQLRILSSCARRFFRFFKPFIGALYSLVR